MKNEHLPITSDTDFSVTLVCTQISFLKAKLKIKNFFKLKIKKLKNLKNHQKHRFLLEFANFDIKRP